MDFSQDGPSTSNDNDKTASNSKTKRTVVQYYGADTNKCGYCKRDPNPEDQFSGRSSYDMQAETITAHDYKELLDRGWRRSGDYCYHPINDKTCCPNYPVICDAENFILSKSQRKCIRNLNSFLIGNNKVDLYHGSKIVKSKSWDKLKTSAKARDKRYVKSILRKVEKHGLTFEDAISQSEMKKYNRMPIQPSLEDYLFPQKSNRISNNSFEPEHRLEFLMHHVESKRAVSMRSNENKLIQKYQKAVHGENSNKWDMSRYCDFLVKSPVITEKIRNFENLDDDEVDCDNLVKKVPRIDSYLMVSPPALPSCYGTYHCVYMLDGEMIAVGVLDVLPKCITTVYFFYNPDYNHLNLGIYSALIEISMTRQLGDCRFDPKLTHYYLGYYVHECKKMRYKTTFKPNYLLCSETFQYVSTELCLKKLKDRKYARFCDDHNNKFNVHADLDSIKHFWKIPVITPVTKTTSILDYFTWLRVNLGPGYDDLLLNYFLVQYIQLIGVDLMQRIYLKLEAIHQALKDRHRKLEQRAPKSESK